MLRPLLSRPSSPALARGLCVFVAGWLLLTYAGNIGLRGWLLFYLGLASYVGSGFVVGYTARRSPIMHGILLSLLITGALALLVAILAGLSDVAGGSGVIATLPFTLMGCTLGAILGDFVASDRPPR